jgi:hypothetical protein
LGRARRCTRDDFGNASHVCSIRVSVARGDARDARVSSLKQDGVGAERLSIEEER